MKGDEMGLDGILFDTFPAANMKVGAHTLHTQLETALTTVIVRGATLLTFDLGTSTNEASSGPAAVLVLERLAHLYSVGPRHSNSNI